MKLETLIKESRAVINELNSYHEGTKSLSLKQFDHLLQLAQNLTQQCDTAIDTTSRSQDTLLQMREKLGRVVNDGSFEADKIDDSYEASGNRFGLFAGSGVPTREGVHVNDFDFSENNNNM